MTARPTLLLLDRRIPRPSSRPGAVASHHGKNAMSEDLNTDINKLVVILDISDSPPADDGWTPVNASDGNRYSYRFSGGTHPHRNGHITHPVDEVTKTVTLKLHKRLKDRYMFDRPVFIFDDDNQLSWHHVTKHSAKFDNKCLKEMDAHYGVRVIDSGNRNATLFCDPAIKNKHPE